jgi:hypothetical protein
MVTWNGKPLEDSHRFQCLNGSTHSLLLEFDHPVSWNGWQFTTAANASVECDPIRFSLHAAPDDDADWDLVGSSTYLNIAGHISLLHGAFPTSPLRGHTHAFDLLRERLRLHTAHAGARGLLSSAASLSSAAGATGLGAACISWQEFVAAAANLCEVRTGREREGEGGAEDQSSSKIDSTPK